MYLKKTAIRLHKLNYAFYEYAYPFNCKLNANNSTWMHPKQLICLAENLICCKIIKPSCTLDAKSF